MKVVKSLPTRLQTLNHRQICGTNVVTFAQDFASRLLSSPNKSSSYGTVTPEYPNACGGDVVIIKKLSFFTFIAAQFHPNDGIFSG